MPVNRTVTRARVARRNPVPKPSTRVRVARIVRRVHRATRQGSW